MSSHRNPSQLAIASPIHIEIELEGSIKSARKAALAGIESENRKTEICRCQAQKRKQGGWGVTEITWERKTSWNTRRAIQAGTLKKM